jgi:hypothetical protein
MPYGTSRLAEGEAVYIFGVEEVDNECWVSGCG